MPVHYELSDYAPGGRAALAAQADGKYYEMSSNLNKNNFGAPGLYYVPSPYKVDLQSLDDMTVTVTIVAEGTIRLNDDRQRLEPYIDGLLFFSNKNEGNPRCNPPVVTLSGKRHYWKGVVYAPFGPCVMSMSENATLQGGIFCWTVDLSGSDVHIEYESDLLPDYLQRIILIR